jgi:hypothetical protein
MTPSSNPGFFDVLRGGLSNALNIGVDLAKTRIETSAQIKTLKNQQQVQAAYDRANAAPAAPWYSQPWVKPAVIGVLVLVGLGLFLRRK